MTSETEEIKKLQKTISELQVELRFLQETVGVLMGAMMEDGESEDIFGDVGVHIDGYMSQSSTY